MADLSRDAYHYAKLRTSGTAARRGRPDAGQDKNKVVLTMDDLSLALSDHGVNARKPDYCESEGFAVRADGPFCTHEVLADEQIFRWSRETCFWIGIAAEGTIEIGHSRTDCHA